MAKAKKGETAAAPAQTTEDGAGTNSNAKSEDTVKEAKNSTKSGKVTKKGKKKGAKKPKKTSKK